MAGFVDAHVVIALGYALAARSHAGLSAPAPRFPTARPPTPSSLSSPSSLTFFFFNDTPPTEIYTLSLHDALPILALRNGVRLDVAVIVLARPQVAAAPFQVDRKSTRLNSSHPSISYAVFCLKKKKKMRPGAVRLRNGRLR